MQEKINKLANYIKEKFPKMSYSEKKHIRNLFNDLMFEIKKLQLIIEKYRGRNEKKYNDLLEKCVNLLYCFGVRVEEIESETWPMNFIEFVILERINKKRELKYTDLNNIRLGYLAYEMEEEKFPENWHQLNEYLNKLKNERNNQNTTIE